MQRMRELLANFFTHKDHLPPADQIAGTLFTPLHLVFAAICALAVAGLCVIAARKCEKQLRSCFGILWAVTTSLEVVKILWETFSGAGVNFDWAGILPLYPCSIFMYAMPFAVWGKGIVRRGACGYVCTLGLLGGLINFVYPANVLGSYSCISFAGLHTLFYHGAIVFCAVTMLASGYHSFTGVTRWQELIAPLYPCLIVSVAAHGVNFSPVGSDYMFFKLNSFFLAPLGQALPQSVCVLIVYGAYVIIHCGPYLPSFIRNHRRISV